MTVLELDKLVTEIYNNTYDDIFKYVLSKCRNVCDIPDILQNTYLNLYSRLKKRGDIEDPKKYLIKIAMHEVYKHYKSQRNSKQNVPVYSCNDDEAFDNIEAELFVETMNEDMLLFDELWQYIRACDDMTYKIFVLYFKYDEKLCNIAKHLKISESMVKNRLYRTIRQIRNKFSF